MAKRARDLDRLLSKYGTGAVADTLGVSASTVRRWKKNGVPEARKSSVKALTVIRQREGFEEKALKEMMGLAKRAGKLPTVKRYSKKRDGRLTTGYEVSSPDNGFLTRSKLLELQKQLSSEKVARGLPNWIASLTVSAYVDEAERAGSADVQLQVDHQDTNNFIVESIISSGRQTNRKDAIAELISKLDRKLREQPDSRFYIHGSYMSSYRYKTEQETRDLQTDKRRHRRRNK